MSIEMDDVETGKAGSTYSEMTTTFQEVLKVVGQVGEAFRSICENLAPFISMVDKIVRQFPPAYRKALMELANEGWYVDPEWMLGDVFSLLSQVCGDGKEQAREWIVQYYSENLDAVEKRLCDRFPNHAKVLSRAFQAHINGHYELSVPVFLIQAESICRSERGCELFGQRAREELKKTDLASRMSAAPLLNSTPMNASSSERDPTSKALNRHRVIHGEDLDYGTLENSFKAISLLAFASSVLVQQRVDFEGDDSFVVASSP